MPNPTLRTWIDVDLDAVKKNFFTACSLTDAVVTCVLKANAYGHGDVPVARALHEAGCRSFAVSCAREALRLRHFGIPGEILVMGLAEKDMLPELIEKDVTLTLADPEGFLSAEAAALQAGKPAVAHVKLDTGMTRTGVNAQEDPGAAAEAVKTMMALPGIQVTGIFTHFAAADMPEKDDYTAMQLERYKTVLAELEKRGIDTTKLLKHTGNSASIMYHPETIFDMMREGVMMYGFYPNGIYDPDGPLEPVLSLNCRVAQVKEIPAGTSVSYGCTFTSERPMKIAAVTAGYADSYPRSLSNKGAWAVINGQRCPQIGRICMDMCMFDVTGKDVKAGDRVILYGRGGMHLDELTALIGTINCEPTCLITNRVKKIYVD